jgi:hypothetical protein
MPRRRRGHERLPGWDRIAEQVELEVAAEGISAANGGDLRTIENEQRTGHAHVVARKSEHHLQEPRPWRQVVSSLDQRADGLGNGQLNDVAPPRNEVRSEKVNSPRQAGCQVQREESGRQRGGSTNGEGRQENSRNGPRGTRGWPMFKTLLSKVGGHIQLSRRA